jgi:hypothetical protein
VNKSLSRITSKKKIPFPTMAKVCRKNSTTKVLTYWRSYGTAPDGLFLTQPDSLDGLWGRGLGEGCL